MVDLEKLKTLAEAATPGRNFDRLPQVGGGLKYECTGDDGALVLKVDHKNDEFGFVGDNGEQDQAFFLACTPAAVLELIAQIEEGKRDFRVVSEVLDKTAATSEARRTDLFTAAELLEEGRCYGPANWNDRVALFLKRNKKPAV